MADFKRRSVWTRIFESKIFLIFLGIFMLFFAWNILKFWGKMRETAKNKKTAEERVVDLREQKEKLGMDIDNLQTSDGKEKVFRENFGLVKEGEEVVVIVEEKAVVVDENKKEGFSFLGFLKSLLKD